MGRRTGGRGFCWSLTVHNATATDRVEMLRQGLGGAESNVSSFPGREHFSAQNMCITHAVN